MKIRGKAEATIRNVPWRALRNYAHCVTCGSTTFALQRATMNRTIVILTSLIALVASSCASAQLPDENYAPAQTIAAAEERDVDNLPEAKLHLKLARDQMQEAEALRKDGKEDEADILMMKAQADADYALAILRRQDQQAETEEVRKKLEELRAEMNQATE